MLQVSGGCLGHKIDESVGGSPKNLTFDDGGIARLEGKIVKCQFS